MNGLQEETEMVRCRYCGRRQQTIASETWTTNDTDKACQVCVPVYSFPIAIAEHNNKEIAICAYCYESGKVVDLTEFEKHNLNFQFGLEYYEMLLFDHSIAALNSAMSYAESAEILTALGNALSRVSLTIAATKCYRRALELDPQYFPARDNIIVTSREICNPFDERLS